MPSRGRGPTARGGRCRRHDLDRQLTPIALRLRKLTTFCLRVLGDVGDAFREAM